MAFMDCILAYPEGELCAEQNDHGLRNISRSPEKVWMACLALYLASRLVGRNDHAAQYSELHSCSRFPELWRRESPPAEQSRRAARILPERVRAESH